MAQTTDEEAAKMGTMYDLVANITHEAAAGSIRDRQVWRAQVRTRVDGKPLANGGENGSAAEAKAHREETWFQIQDLIVEQVNRQMLFLGETYIQVGVRIERKSEVHAWLTCFASPADRSGSAKLARARSSKSWRDTNSTKSAKRQNIRRESRTPVAYTQSVNCPTSRFLNDAPFCHSSRRRGSKWPPRRQGRALCVRVGASWRAAQPMPQQRFHIRSLRRCCFRQRTGLPGGIDALTS